MRVLAATTIALALAVPPARPREAAPSRVAMPCERPLWIAEGDQTDCRFGTISSAGDVNGDGFPDVVIGSYNHSDGQTNEGRIYLYLGGPTGLSLIPAWTFESDQAGAQLGDKLSGAGDVNGDGYDDVIAGAVGYDGTYVDEGKAYLFLGSPAGLSGTPAWSATGGQTGASFGSCARGAGDVNGDGYDDVIIGAWLYDTNLTDAGKAFLYLGGPAGLSPTPAWTNGGEATGAVFGYFVNAAGDLDHDGYADIVVGSRRFSGNGINKEGKVYVYHGSPAGPSLAADWTKAGGQAKGEFGAAVGSAGDVNGDGYDDLMVGAFRQSHPDSAEGRAYVFLGGPGGLATTPIWSGEGDQKNAEFGYHLGAGDINHDGYSDLVVSAVTQTVNGLADAGRVYVYHGGASGPSATPAWTYDGDQAGQRLGDAVTVLGDIDRDGFADFGAGALYRDNAFVDAGRACVFYGCADSLTLAVSRAAERESGLAMVGPNPFIGGTLIGYALSRPEDVRLRVVDLAGRTVRVLAHGVETPGRHVARWDGRAADGSMAPAGVYFVQLKTPAAASAVKVTKLR
jgi:hypothetical protein